MHDAGWDVIEKIRRKIFLEVLWKNELYKFMAWMLLLNTVYSKQI